MNKTRKHICPLFLINSALLLAICSFFIFQQSSQKQQTQISKTKLAKRLLLTDLCLTTESRHTRHISQSDWVAPFQDLPGFHDHFPSSSFFPAPDSTRWIISVSQKKGKN